MLERFAAQVLNHYIGQYVEDFNQENLSIGIVKGAVELEGLSLRKDALKELDLPGVEVKWGYIGKIALRIPSYKNYNEPWVIDINKLYLIVGPSKQQNTFDADAHKSKKEKRKQTQLSALEDKWKATQGSTKSIYAIWHAYSSSIVTNIVENLQVRLFDLHIRYEDDITLPSTFSCGIHINVLSAQSTDENWVPKTANLKGDSKKWKKMQLSDMSFYWNTKSILFGSMEHTEIVSNMERQLVDKENPSYRDPDDNNQSNQFILQPVSGDARFTRDCSAFPLRSASKPRLALSLSLSSIPLYLEKTQYQQIVTLASEVARWDKQRQHRSDKPQQEISENPSSWWNWAIQSHLKIIRQKRQRSSMSYILERAKLNVKYTREYRELLHTKYVLKTQNTELSFSIDFMESDLSFDELRILRELVYNKIDEETKLKQDAEKKLKSSKAGLKTSKSSKGSSWRLAGWLGWGRKRNTSDSDAESPSTDSDDEKLELVAKTISQKTLEESVFEDLNDDELFEVFGDDLQDTNDTFLKRDSVLLKLDFSLESGTFTLLDTRKMESEKGIVSLEFDSVNLSSQWKPRYGTSEVSADLGGMILRDLTRQGEPFYELLKPAPVVKPSSPAVVTPPLLTSGMRNLASNVFNNLFTQAPTKITQVSEPDRNSSPVFSITYEKLPHSNTTNFSDRLEVVTAPLSFTVIPGMFDQLKKFFSTRETDIGTAYELDSEVLSSAARSKYDSWMKRTQGEIRRSVKRIIEGKSKAKVSQKRWAISLDIFAPEILIPDDCSNLNSNIVVFNLGHMTFDNHAGEAGKSRKRNVENVDESSSDKSVGSQVEDDDDDDDDYFQTPPNTPPSETAMMSEPDEKSDSSDDVIGSDEPVTSADGGKPPVDEGFINPEKLSERMLREKMYERYHLNVSDMQVAVAPDASRLDAIRSGGKSSHHLVERFSVDLVVEKRLVPTYDPLFPSLVLTGNLPHLTLHVSHSKVFCITKCLNQFRKNDPEHKKSKSAPSSSSTSFLNVGGSSSKLSNELASNLEKAHSKQLACDFTVNQISVVLEQGENLSNQTLSVLEVSRIQTKFVMRPYDTSTSLSIYSLLLVDVMQQLGHDYELLLASHRNVFMDVGSGNMLDSGAASPFSSSQTRPSNATLKSNVGNPLPSPTLQVPTTNVLANVAENLRQFANPYDPFGAEEVLVSAESKAGPEVSQFSEHLIKLELKSLKPGSPEFELNNNLDEDQPCNLVNAYFSNLDVVFNANSWITLLDFVHKLKPDTPTKKTGKGSIEIDKAPLEGNTALKPTTAHTRLNSEAEVEEPIESHIVIDFKKLNILLLRHIYLPVREVGHKVATLTMHGAHVIADVNCRAEQAKYGNLTANLDLRGSLSGLQMQDLSSFNACTEVLSLGTTDENNSVHGDLLASLNATQTDQSTHTKAFSFEVVHGPLLSEIADGIKLCERSTKKQASEPTVANFVIMPDNDRLMASESDLCDLMFSMDDETRDPKTSQGFKSEARVAVKVASACYIHSPRLVAEVLALIDETGDITRAHMTSDTRQAYKDMARSIVDKVSDYSMAMLARSAAFDEQTEEIDLKELHPDEEAQQSPYRVHKETNSTRLRLQVQMQSPLVALPKYPGSYELLVANLGQITIRNVHELNSDMGAMDVLNIEVVDMDLRSHRQKSEELAAKRNASGSLCSSGPSISKLKEEGERMMAGEDVQILHKTSLQLSVVKRSFVPNPKNLLDARSCCSEKSRIDQPESTDCCDDFASCVGAISDKRMCVEVRAATALTVTLSKLAYEQVLKTLDNVAYGGDIDQVDEARSVASDREDTPPKHPKHSDSAPVLLETPGKKSNLAGRRATLSTTSQSTPHSDREFSLFDAPGLEITPQRLPSTSQSATSLQTRKYTPISASFRVPSLIFQLSGDLSEGEQGIVKVTLQRFHGSYEKENRFGTSIDLSLGSLDIEDMLQPEGSSDRHIVVSYTPGCKDTRNEREQVKTEYLSTSCPAFTTVTMSPRADVSTSFPSSQKQQFNVSQPTTARGGVFRPYEKFGLSSGAFGSTTQRKRKESSRNSVGEHGEVEEPPTPPSSPQPPYLDQELDEETEDHTLVHIRAFLVDGKSVAYSRVYNRVNRRVDVDFNMLDCKINLQTWVVLLDFFGIGTSPKKTYQLDRETEETYSWDKRLDIRSFYENQPDEHINSEIDFVVKRFTLIFNKPEYELLKADVTGLKLHGRIRDGTLNVKGQLGGLAVHDMSPNGSLYRDRFMFTGDRALDFDIMKYDEYDHKLEREFDISVRLRMTSIRYVHTQRFQNEVVAYLQHFQQLQEVLGRMRAASVGQSVRTSSCRQARVKLDIETGATIILLPESSHADRLLVANLGNINLRNEFLRNGDPGTLASYSFESEQNYMDLNGKMDTGGLVGNQDVDVLASPTTTRRCILDVIHVSLVDMDLYTATFTKRKLQSSPSRPVQDLSHLVFPSYTVQCNGKPLLKDKVQLKLQMERNLEKEITHYGVPDTAMCARLSSVYCALDHTQYWLVRGALDHNAGEAIPDFPQPTAFLQPSKLHTVLTGDVYTGLSMDFHLTNVSIELLFQHATDISPAKSLGRMDFMKSVLSYRAFSDNKKTTNLSCKAFRAIDTRWQLGGAGGPSNTPSVFTTILGPMTNKPSPSVGSDSDLLQFEIHQRSGPGFMEFTALLNNMRVYVILDWLNDMNKYLIQNPNQARCDSLREKTAQRMAQYKQMDSGNQRRLDDLGQLEPEVRSNEFKLNVTETEFVVVQDSARFDTDAVILRSTAVLQVSPEDGATQQSQATLSRMGGNLPLRCGLERLEMFSCQLDKENETALSIIDPVTVQIEVRPIKQVDLMNLDISHDYSVLDRNLLEIHISDLNMRVSYNDIMLFLAILKSLPIQAGIESKSLATKHDMSASTSSESTKIKAVYKPNEETVRNLTTVGYSRNDVIYALSVNNGDISRAGSWLVDNATLQANAKKHVIPSKRDIPFAVARVSLKVDAARVCLIDDCADDCDVPLAEFAIHSLHVRQGVAPKFERSMKDCVHGQRGSSSFKLTGDYYNRLLSLWEPFLEPWRCNVAWQHEQTSGSQSSSGTWNLKIEASDRFDVSVTSALMDTLKKTSSTWQRDYEGSQSKTSQSGRVRHPFVPYALRNLTGTPLMFVTQTAALHKADVVASVHPNSSASSDAQWTEVFPGEEKSFHFATSHEKQRHKRTGLLKLHQIRVKVGEWKTLKPVTVSRVGVYFRHAFAHIDKSSKVYESMEPVRVVFSVALEGSAQKVVTVRSALAVKSRVKIPIQLQLEKQDVDDTSVMSLPTLDPGETQYIPLNMTSCAMRVRPRVQMHGPYYYSSKQIEWQTCSGAEKEKSLLVECKPSQSTDNAKPFHFAVCIQQKGFPSYEEVQEILTEQGEIVDQDVLDRSSSSFLTKLPGHTIIILPPVVISNLLPCDLNYYVKNTSVEGRLKPGMDATPHTVRLLPGHDRQSSSLIIGCLLENFKSCRELVVPANIKNFQMRMVIKDYNDQSLILNVRILWRFNCSVKISVMAGYWIVNTTGLPIIVKQESCTTIAAGQYDTHEQARSLAPLLFSYANRESPYLCTMRLGRKAQLEKFTRQGLEVGGSGPRAIPAFCERFSTDGGSCTRTLKLVTHDGTPNREFYIGISVRRGWGRYLHTHIVTVAPRFLLINRTKSKRLSFAQRHAISYTSDSAGNSFHLTIVPGSSVVFHWPRVDLDNLLCVKLADEPACHWSGGFFIDRTDAFHVALRLAAGRSGLLYTDVHPLAPHCIFLSVEVTLVDATFCISINDADPSLVPPPLRIDNVSAAPVIFKQVGTDESFNTDVPAETQLAYACDEPCFPYHLQCSVKGSSQQVTLDMSNIGIEKQLYYENFIYITVGLSPTQTFYSGEHDCGAILVMEVQQTSRGGHVITLQPLRTGKRSQLWRMTSDGRIFHVGSSPPDKDSIKPSLSNRNQGLVLDIGEMAFTPGRSLDEGIPLALKQTDERRRSTQTWSFGDDGRLHCRHRNLCARAGDLRVNSVVVLATFDEHRVPLPRELCSRHKMISGSGVLSLKVVRDGPTRVLRIVDIRQKRAGIFSMESDWTILESDKRVMVTDERNGGAVTQSTAKFTASLSMAKGVGISLVNNTPEELLYLTMNGVQMDLSLVPGEQIFSLRVQKLQLDNQLLDGHPPVMLCPRTATTTFTSSSRTESSPTDPLISVRAVRQPSSSRLYQIFKSFSIDVGRLSLQIEERLLLKLFYFVGFGPSSSARDSEVLDEAKMDLNRAVCNINDDNVATRFYFDTIRLSAAPMRLSVFTASRLNPELKAVKRALRFSMVQFERAPVSMQPYSKRHLFETVAFILAEFSKHLRQELKGQAAKILGSVDFLGNPIGLLTDVKAGMTGLARGNLPNMVKHFTHGISDSTAKVVSTLSGGLGEITMDEEYEDKRRAIQSNAKNASGHVVAGLQGFMAGMIGGLTSVITQPVRGAQNDGAIGFVKGIGKGIVGTVTKPVTGVLDLASESASAVREISVSSDQVYTRARPIRCCHTFQGCLQVYSESQAKGQQFLYALNRNDFSEHFYASNKLSFHHRDNMLVLITSSKVYFVKDSEPDPDHVFLEVDYSNLLGVRVLPGLPDQSHASVRSRDSGKALLELTVKPTFNQMTFKTSTKSLTNRQNATKPRVVCHSDTVAERVCQQINYARTIASEQIETLHCDPVEEEAEVRSFDLEV